ncbi:acetylglutamate kinase [Zavarzinella formosa]|uniref:acetylglutamate kinase n=1 Tax=Zavarzinella formosa TaxID=360055 RepID=UPI0002D5B118|nr:acetylglutamate kinase [Zavarzinella formosa]
MDDAIRKAEALVEALSYIRRFRDRLTVVKLGGSAMEEPAALRATLQSVVFLETVGLRPVLVHGGGKPIDRAMAASGLVPKKIQGRRYTDDATLGIVVDVLTHDVNAGIVRQIRELGGRAVGLHTSTLQALHGERLMLPNPGGEPIDLGRVGQVTKVDGGLIGDFAHAGVVPVIPSLAYDADGGWLNVNADTAACAVAAELKAAKFVMLTDTPGILRNPKDPATLIQHLDSAECRQLVAEGVIDGGMIPKVEACFEALRAGVGKIHVIDGRQPYSLLLEIFTDTGVGTEIVL